MLIIDKHEILLKQILKDIYKNKILRGQLAFKGGTCLYMFYGLERFSTDLDFNHLSNDLDEKELTSIISNYLKIDEKHSKKYTWIWIGSYEKGLQKIKIEVNKRKYPDKYINIDFLGISIPTMQPEYMFAHKLCAITDRRILQNRDLFDSWFMFQKQWEPNEEIIKIRTGLSKNEYYEKIIDFINARKHRISILDGLGEVLDKKKKIWVKENLLEELLFQLKIRL
jgi:predicted nucleotidyltransferase component of viral defense system